MGKDCVVCRLPLRSHEWEGLRLYPPPVSRELMASPPCRDLSRLYPPVEEHRLWSDRVFGG